MVTAAWDTSNLVAFYSGGVQCETCCNIGDPCTHCDVDTPKTIFVQITGAVDFLEGLCLCVDYPVGSAPSKFEGMAADDVLNDLIVECTQTEFDDCIWTASVALDAATLKTYTGASCPLGPPNCGTLGETRKMCWLFYEVTRNAADIQVKISILGEDTPGSELTNCEENWYDSAVRETVTCDGDHCICCEKEGGLVVARYWDLTGATIRTWSTLCDTMHVNDVSSQAIVSDCGGDEEKSEVTVIIHDSDDAVLANAHVEITLTGAVSDVVYADTNGSGVATYTSDCLCINGTINVEVTNITKGGYVWDSDDDEDSLTDSIVMDCV